MLADEAQLKRSARQIESAQAEAGQKEAQMASQIVAAEERGKATNAPQVAQAMLEVAELQRKLASSQAEAEDANRRADAAQAGLRHGQSEEQAARRSATTVQTLEVKLAEAEREAAALVGRERAAREDAAETEEKLAEASRALSKAKLELSGAREQVEELEEERDSERRELRRLKLSASEAEQEAEATAARLRREISEAEQNSAAQLSALQQKLRAAEAEREAEADRAQAAADNAERAEGRLASERAEVEQLTAQLAEQRDAVAASTMMAQPNFAANTPWGGASSPGQPQHQTAAQAPSPTAAGLSELATEIRGLAQLHADEIITTAEFTRAKARLLNPSRSAEAPTGPSASRAVSTHVVVPQRPSTITGRLQARKERRQAYGGWHSAVTPSGGAYPWVGQEAVLNVEP